MLTDDKSFDVCVSGNSYRFMVYPMFNITLQNNWLSERNSSSCFDRLFLAYSLQSSFLKTKKKPKKKHEYQHSPHLTPEDSNPFLFETAV